MHTPDPEEIVELAQIYTEAGLPMPLDVLAHADARGFLITDETINPFSEQDQ